MTDRKWIGTHQFRLNSFNGDHRPNSPYGNQGKFYSAQSEIITVKISDPCIDSKILANEIFPETLSVRAGSTLEELKLKGPKDSVSIDYGNGYDMCGPLGYQVLTEKSL